VPKLAAELRSYVATRWLPSLVEHVLGPTPRLRKGVLRKLPSPLKLGRVRTSAQYLEEINVSALAELIERNDIGAGGDWVKTINAWLARRAPEPESIRRTLTALGFDWVVGLGLSGYKQHAIAMLHSLYCNDECELATLQARMIFQEGPCVKRTIEWDSLASRRVKRYRPADSPENSRLEKAAKRSWPNSGILPIPTKPAMPRDLYLSQNLYVAWCVLEVALNTKGHTFEAGMSKADEIATSFVLSWVEDISHRK
jgi:hypothetical protein